MPLNEKNQRVILSIQDLALKQAWWYMFIIPVVGRLWWGFDKIKLNLGYIVDPGSLGYIVELCIKNSQIAIRKNIEESISIQ